MTFSIVARSRDGRWGVGVVSKYLAAPSAVASVHSDSPSTPHHIKFD